MSTNPLFLSGEENEKVLRNPHADLDHHQKLTTSRGLITSCPCLPSLVDVRFRIHQLSCLQNSRMNDRTTDKTITTSTLLAEIKMQLDNQ